MEEVDPLGLEIEMCLVVPENRSEDVDKYICIRSSELSRPNVSYKKVGR